MEYNNTVRDLFGVTSNPADQFPADDGGGGGFDNTADTLFVPPILMERYLSAAADVLDEGSQVKLFFVRPGKTLTPRASAKKIVTHYATLAFRRPVEPAETERLLRLFDKAKAAGDDFEAATKFALKGVLISPNFLFRIERDRPTTEAYPISDYELASRLSYFLWSSMPDDELFAQAAAGKLHKPEVLDREVKRMLWRARSPAAFSDSFAGRVAAGAGSLLHRASRYGNQFKDYTPRPARRDVRRDHRFLRLSSCATIASLLEPARCRLHLPERGTGQLLLAFPASQASRDAPGPTRGRYAAAE